MTEKEETKNTDGVVPDADSPAQEETVAGPNWTVMDIGAIVVALAGEAYTLLPWGVYNNRLESLDIALMATPVFILVAALLSYAGTVLVKKTKGTRSAFAAGLARIVIWGSIITLLPMFIHFGSLLLNPS